jgi:hypothetical protein
VVSPPSPACSASRYLVAARVALTRIPSQGRFDLQMARLCRSAALSFAPRGAA